MAQKKFALAFTPQYGSPNIIYLWKLPKFEVNPLDNKTVMVVRGMDLSVDWLRSPDTTTMMGVIGWRLVESFPYPDAVSASPVSQGETLRLPVKGSDKREICRDTFAISANDIQQESVQSSVILPKVFEEDCDKTVVNFDDLFFHMESNIMTNTTAMQNPSMWHMELTVTYEMKKLSDVEYFKLASSCCLPHSEGGELRESYLTNTNYT